MGPRAQRDAGSTAGTVQKAREKHTRTGGTLLQHRGKRRLSPPLRGLHSQTGKIGAVWLHARCPEFELKQ